MPAKKFTKELLEETLKRDNATLVGEHDKLNKEAMINFKCNCGNEHKKQFRCLVNLGGCYCLECSNKHKADKARETFVTNYGVDNPLKNEEIKKKVIETFILKYNTDNPMKNEEIKHKKLI